MTIRFALGLSALTILSATSVAAAPSGCFEKVSEVTAGGRLVPVPKNVAWTFHFNKNGSGDGGGGHSRLTATAPGAACRMPFVLSDLPGSESEIGFTQSNGHFDGTFTLKCLTLNEFIPLETIRWWGYKQSNSYLRLSFRNRKGEIRTSVWRPRLCDAHQPDQFSPAVIGGDAVAENDRVARSTVAVFNVISGELCTGSILASRIVVTAGHCVSANAKDLFVVSKPNVNSITKDDLHFVSSQIVHARYKPGKPMGIGAFDIALAKITGAFPIPYEPALRLPLDIPLLRGENVLVAGFGIAQTPGTNGSSLTSGILRKTDKLSVLNTLFGENEVLVDQSRGHSACFGDSGGPAYVMSASGDPMLWGVTSRGHSPTSAEKCASAVVFTSLNSLQPWLEQAMVSLRDD